MQSQTLAIKSFIRPPVSPIERRPRANCFLCGTFNWIALRATFFYFSSIKKAIKAFLWCVCVQRHKHTILPKVPTALWCAVNKNPRSIPSNQMKKNKKSCSATGDCLIGHLTDSKSTHSPRKWSLNEKFFNRKLIKSKQSRTTFAPNELKSN